MKYYILLVALFSASSLFGAVDNNVNSKLQQAAIQTALAKSEVALANSKTAIAESKAAEAIEMATQAKIELAQIRTEAENQARAEAEAENQANAQKVLSENNTIHISVVGQGVAPMNTSSPAQAYALAKRAAVADAYRAIAEKVKGVRIDGQDLIKNMMVKRSIIRTSVKAMVRNANIVETTFKEGLCEVEMEIIISHSDFAQ